MTDIIQYAASADLETLNKINKQVFNHLLVNTTLTVGFNVRDKVGGPVMMVQGFRSSVPSDYEPSYKPSPEGDLIALESYPKIKLNTERLTYKEIYNRSNVIDGSPTYIFYNDLLAEESDKVSNTLLVVCKYWSDRHDGIVIVVKHLHELEIVKD
jgi:hypothetical protein